MKLEHSLTLYTKINSKWIRGLNGRLDNIKLLEENTGRKLFDINHSNIIFDLPSRVMKIKINKCNLIKLKSFAQQRKPFKKNEKTTCRMGENIWKWCNWQDFNFQNIQTTQTAQLPTPPKTTQSKNGQKT